MIHLIANPICVLKLTYFLAQVHIYQDGVSIFLIPNKIRFIYFFSFNYKYFD